MIDVLLCLFIETKLYCAPLLICYLSLFEGERAEKSFDQLNFLTNVRRIIILD
jgi:hypothetical protein